MTKSTWEQVSNDPGGLVTLRMKVPGGWLYAVGEELRESYATGKVTSTGLCELEYRHAGYKVACMTFVPQDDGSVRG